MNSNRKRVVGLLIATFIFLSGAAWGQDIRDRMSARLPAIVALKAAGVVGENNQGYLTVLKPPTDKQALIDAENQDRRIVYDDIAKKKNTSPELVGRRRAMQIAKKADPGFWIQDAKGKWVKK